MSDKKRLSISVGLAIATSSVIAMIACSSTQGQSSQSSSDYSGPHTSACSTGEPWGKTTNDFPPPPPSPSEFKNLPDCVPRCGEQKINGLGISAYSLAGLPSGACTAEGEQCSLSALGTATCNGETEACNYSAFECRCTGLKWQCYVTSQGTGTCGVCETDASTDAD